MATKTNTNRKKTANPKKGVSSVKNTTKKTTNAKKSTKSTSIKKTNSKAKNVQEIKTALNPKTTPKKSVKTTKSAPKKTVKVASKTAEKKKVVAKENNIPTLLPVELPKTKKEKAQEQENKVLEATKDIHETNEQQPKKAKTRKKSHAQKIAKNKTSEFTKKLKKLQRQIKIYGINSVISKKHLITSIILIVLSIFAIVAIINLRPMETKINLDNISQEIDQVKTLKYDISNTLDIIKDSGAYKSYDAKTKKLSLNEYYEYDFKNFNLTRGIATEYKIYYNEKNKELFMVFKPDTDCADKIKSGITTFLKSKKITATEEEYDGYIFYVSSTDDKKVISKIKQSQVKAFNILQELNKDEIKEKYGIQTNLYTDYKVKTAMIVKSAVTEYLILKPKNNEAAKEIEAKMNEYYEQKEKTWESDSENLWLIKNRYTGVYNGYLVYIVSRDNDLVMQLLKK